MGYPKEVIPEEGLISIKIEGEVLHTKLVPLYDKNVISVIVGGDIYGLEFELLGKDGEYYKNPEKVGGGTSIQIPTSNLWGVSIKNTMGKKNEFWVKAFYLDSNNSTPTPTST